MGSNTSMNELQKREHAKLLEEFNSLAESIEARAQEECVVDTGSYEEMRDAFRFFSKLQSLLVILSVLALIVAGASYALRDKEKAFATDIQGNVTRIK